MTSEELHRYKQALQFAHNAEIEILRLRSELADTKAQLAEVTELASDCIVAIATQAEPETGLLVVVLA